MSAQLVQGHPGFELALTLVALARVPVVASAAVDTIAPGLLGDLARVRGVGGGVEVGLPDVHLGAAGAVLSGSRAAVGATPAINVGLAVDELDVLRALAVAVARAVLGAGLVALEARQAAVLVHLAKVDGAVQAAGELGHVHVHGELLIEQVKEAVLGIAGHQVHAGADVRPVVVLGDKVELQRPWRRRRDAVRLLIVGTVKGAVGRACLAVGARRGVPGAAGVAVGVAAGDVSPAPVGLGSRGQSKLSRDGTSSTYVKNHGGRLLGARAGSRANLDGKRRVRLARDGTDLLAEHEAGKRERCCYPGIHDDGLSRSCRGRDGLEGTERSGLSEHCGCFSISEPTYTARGLSSLYVPSRTARSGKLVPQMVTFGPRKLEPSAPIRCHACHDHKARHAGTTASRA